MSRPFQLDEHSTLNSLKSIQLFPWNLKPLIWYTVKTNILFLLKYNQEKY